MTHLHADHVGWNTTAGQPLGAHLPNARYYIPKDDFVFCEQGRNKEPGVVDVFGESFFDSVMPVVNEGLAEMIVPAGDRRLPAGGGRRRPQPGRSPSACARAARAVFCGDILHSPLQIVRPDVNSGYCIRRTARSTRLGFLHRAADSGALVLPVHFGEPYCGYVRREGQGFRFEPAGW